MKKDEVIEVLEQYRNERNEHALIKVLKERLVEELETYDVSDGRQKHDLNLIIRDLEEELDYIESEKLSEFDPEQQ